MLPASTPIVQSYDRIMTAFPGGPAPALVVVKAPDIQAPAARQAIAALAGWHSPAIGQPIEVNVYPAANLAQITIPLAGSGTDATSRHALTTLHDTIVPATVGKIPGGEALVGGNLAARRLQQPARHGIVPVFAFVMGVTFLLMLAAFGSIVIATTTIGLNLLSVGAAYGVLVAVFQHGWGAALIGTTAPGAMESWIPLFIFVVLFGLSMDYNVFVVSRIKEGHDHGMATSRRSRTASAATAGVVTSAAVIMVAVFAVFGTLSLQQFKQLSVGLAVAVLLDATVVRGVLLPSVMTLLGDRNWYLPRWLSRLSGWPPGRPWRPPIHARARTLPCHPRHARGLTPLTRSRVVTARAGPARCASLSPGSPASLVVATSQSELTAPPAQSTRPRHIAGRWPQRAPKAHDGA